MNDGRAEVPKLAGGFPAHFKFGAATAAYQIEGAADDDGRGMSIWDEFCGKAGRIRGGDNGDRACEHYFRYRQDTAVMRQLALQSYRFSISWPRVLPNGTGPINQRGLSFYQRLVDELLASDITPFVTLFHWDMPSALMQRYGGFLDRRAAQDYADYVEVVVRALGDRVKHWITINEPFEHAFFGYVMGSHAPGLRRPWSYPTVMHHQLLAHGMAVERIRAERPGAQVGIALSLTPIHPSPDGNFSKNQTAARTANELMNFITLDPLLRGCYPEDLCRRLRWFPPRIDHDDMKRIQAPLDFIGVNNYQREHAYFSRWIPFLQSWINGGGALAESESMRDGVQYTSMGWEVYPPAMHEVLSWLRRDYGNPPVYITENGAAFEDALINGTIHDPKRIAYIAAYLAEVQRAIAEGADVRGYFVWSLLDNFEWAAGYSKRFGIVHVDYKSQARTIKSSGLWYAEQIRAHLEAHQAARIGVSQPSVVPA
jgi:beta-glucosidase